MLAAKSGGFMETVVPGETGWLHEPGDAEDLAKSVIAMERAGGGGRRAMGVAGRRWLEGNASAERWRVSFEKVIASLPAVRHEQNYEKISPIA